jgi:glutamate-1-semialdehyde 2,1-aminomutase
MCHFDKNVVGADRWLMQLGTLSGNPVAAAAGLKTMEVLRREGAYEQLRKTGMELQRMQSDALNAAGIAHQICGDPTLFDIFFTDRLCTDYRSAKHTDPATSTKYNAVLRANGIFKAPGKLYPSLAITEQDLQRTQAAVALAAAAIGET